jgi:O-antigen ligase
LFVVWGGLDGGYGPTVWYPGGLFLVGLLAAAALAAPRPLRMPGPMLAALASFAAFTAWCFASIAWADVRGDAWDGANRTLLYLAVYALFGCLVWRPPTAAAVFGSFSLAVAVLGAAVFFGALVNGDTRDLFLGNRFFEPLGYENANAAYFLMAFWPALFLAGRREVPTLARALLLGAAGVVVELAVLAQSRGSLFAFPVVLLVYLAVVPSRVRSLVALVPIAVVVALASSRLLDVYELAGDVPRQASVSSAGEAVALSFVALVIVGLAYGFLDRRIELSENRARGWNRAAGVVAAAAATVAAAIVLVAVGNPAARASAAWDDFRAGEAASSDDASRFTSFGSNRYDMWRVAWNEFTANPVRGVGVDNFATDQLRERRTNEEPRYPHSFELRLLSQTGVVGALLFGAFLVSALLAAWRARADLGLFGRGVGAALVVTFAYWCVHGSIDWFWEFPALGAAAFACLATAGRLDEREAAPPSKPRRRLRAFGLLAAGLIVAVFTVASFTAPWLAARYVEAATQGWRTEPQGSYDALDRARSLNFLSDRPDLFAGAIAVRRHEWQRAHDAFERVLERNSKNWYAYLELGVLDSMAGRRESAALHLRHAQALNPREEVIRLALERISRREPITTQEVDGVFRQRVENRFGLFR